MRRWLIALGLAVASTSYASSLKDGTPAEVKADFDLICHAVTRSGAAKEKDPRTKAERIATNLLGHIMTKQAMHVMQSMGGLLPEDKPAALKKAAADAGYQGPCPFADEK
jgi:hypothetical protein